MAVAILFRAGTHRMLKRGFRAPRLEHRTTPADLGMGAREARIRTVNGKRLFAWLIPSPNGGAAPALLVMHGWGANASVMLPAVRPLYEAGYTLLMIDARCHGRSDDDDFASMPRFAEDIECALDWLEDQPEADRDRIVIVGHSVGAGAALLVTSRRPGIRAVISVSAFAHPREVMRRLLAQKRLPYLPIGWYALHKVQSLIGFRFDDIAPETTIKLGTCPVLLAHGRNDATIPFSDAERLLKAGVGAGRRVQLLATDGGHEADIDLLRERDSLLQFLSQVFEITPDSPGTAANGRLTAGM